MTCFPMERPSSVPMHHATEGSIEDDMREHGGLQLRSFVGESLDG